MGDPESKSDIGSKTESTGGDLPPPSSSSSSSSGSQDHARQIEKIEKNSELPLVQKVVSSESPLKSGGDGENSQEKEEKELEKKTAAVQHEKSDNKDSKTTPSGSDEGRSTSKITSSTPEESVDDEKEFEPSVEMMINDFDDERTLEEEEANENQEDESEELTALEQEQDMPLEELLKMYGYGSEQTNDSQTGGEIQKEPTKTCAKKLSDSTKGPSRKKHLAQDDGNDAEDEDEGDDDSPIVNPSVTLPPTTSQTNMSLVDEDDDDDDDEKKLEIVESKEEYGKDEDEEDEEKLKLCSPPPAKKSKSELARFYEATVEGRSLRSNNQNEEEEEEDVKDDVNEGPESDQDENREYSWKKTIMIGPSYQASVPGGLCQYGDSLPYENEDKLLWDPKLLSPDEVEDYLAKSQETLASTNNSHGSGVGSIPMGAHIRDDEQALFLLLQCGYNYEEALRRRRMNAIPPADTMSLWSEEECRAFELGLRLYGKDFTMIQQQKVRTRSVGELVQFYYLWKKTERHDVFANSNRMEKKKYTLHPGTTDYMDRFIDEQDQSRDRSSSPNYHSLIFGDSNLPASISISGSPSSKKPGISSSKSNDMDNTDIITPSSLSGALSMTSTSS